ncbi:MAG: GNAT family N-acetyltransferase [Verrucomicrobiales bacterium]
MRELYLSVRDSETGIRELDPGTRTRLLQDQFQFQRSDYRLRYPHANFLIVQADARPAGRFYLHHGADSIHVIEISLLPEFQGHGIGSTLIRTVQAEARRSGRAVTLFAHPRRAGSEFYQRLGFVQKSVLGEHAGLHWRAAG